MVLVPSEGRAQARFPALEPGTTYSQLRSYPIRSGKHIAALGRQLSMSCCNFGTVDPKADDLLSGARLVLVTTQRVAGAGMVPIPGIGPVITVLISLVDKITVCIFREVRRSVQSCLLTLFFRRR